MAENIDLNLNLNTGNADNSLNGLTQKLSDLKSRIGDVGVGSAEFKKLQQEIIATDTKLKNLNTSIEGVSTEKLVGEIGKFAGGMTQAFAGMSLLIGKNNKSLEEMQKNLNTAIGIVMGVKGAMDAFTAATNLAKVAQMALNKTMSATVWGAILAAIVAVGYALYDVYKEQEKYNEKLVEASKNTENYTKSNEKLKESQDSLTEGYAGEISELNILFKVAKDSVNNKEQYAKAIDEINKRYGEYLPNLLTEKTSIDEFNKVI